MESYTRKYNLVLAQHFLYLASESKDWDQAFASLGKKHSFDEKKLKKEKKGIINLLTKLVKTFQREQGDKMSLVKYYFGAPDEEEKLENMSLLVLLSEITDLIHLDKEDQLRERLLGYSQEEYMRRFATALCSYNNPYIKNDSHLEQINSLEIMRFILESDFSDDIKCRLQDLYLNREKHIDILCRIMGDAARLLLRFEDELNEELQKFYDYWDNRRNGRSFYDFLREDFSIFSQAEEYPMGYELVPCLFPFTMSLATPTGPESSYQKSVLCIGVLFGDAYDLSKLFSTEDSLKSTDAVVDAIKLLSDRSRFEILKYISHKEAYGNEIAEHLNLTTATVSHHMGLLIAADLVKLEPRNSKMYYSLNKDTLRQYLEFYEEKLL